VALRLRVAAAFLPAALRVVLFRRAVVFFRPVVLRLRVAAAFLPAAFRVVLFRLRVVAALVALRLRVAAAFLPAAFRVVRLLAVAIVALLSCAVCRRGATLLIQTLTTVAHAQTSRSMVVSFRWDDSGVSSSGEHQRAVVA
jgi:hypothetical protein